MRIQKKSKIYISGHQGLAGAAILRCLREEGFRNLLVSSRKTLDLTRQDGVADFFKKSRPDIVIHCAARVGGIFANRTYPANFIYENLMMQTNVIHCAHRFGVKKLIFFGSSCSYPASSEVPTKEDALLEGRPEITNEAYAVAKIAGIKMCQSYQEQYGDPFIVAVPANLYGPGDNFDLENSHVIPALIRKFHEALIAARKSVVVWGSGKPRREFLFVDDLANAVLFLLKNYSDSKIINVAATEEISIKELAHLIKRITGFSGRVEFDSSHPDGAKRKKLDGSRLKKLGWRAKTGLAEGIKQTYRWFLKNRDGKKFYGKK